MKRWLIYLFIVLCSSSYADEYITITNQVDIDKILIGIKSNDVSMGYINIYERLPKIGLHVKSISIARYKQDDVKSSMGNLRNGDVQYQFFAEIEDLNVVKKICPISDMFVFAKRGKNYIPQDRTANFIINGYKFCKAP